MNNSLLLGGTNSHEQQSTISKGCDLILSTMFFVVTTSLDFTLLTTTCTQKVCFIIFNCPLLLLHEVCKWFSNTIASY